jgi:RNA polymerase sigma-70 factor (ECF subfamily)
MTLDQTRGDASTGREATAEALFIRYGRGVGRYVLARLGDAELAEDITARVFLTVVRRLAQCRGAVAAWLWTIVQHEIVNHFRTRRPNGPPDESLADTSPSPSEQLTRREFAELAVAAMEQLPPRQQELMYLKFFQDLPNTQIAEATGLSVSNVGVLIHRALKQLRAAMPGDSP